MKRSLIGVGICGVVLSTACNRSESPTGPSAVRPLVVASGDEGGGSATTTSRVSVPFKGSVEGQYGTPSGQFPLIHESIAATGQATHLGRYTLAIEETVNLLEASAAGTFTFTAANGDTVYGNFDGLAQLGPVVTITEQATVLGGTGRFDGATGSFTIKRTFDPVNRTTAGSFDGTISAVGGQ